MAVGFSTVSFSVVPDDEARLVMPTPADDGDYSTLDITIMLANRAAYTSLLSFVSGYTILPAMGGGGLVVVTRGLGRRTLTIPVSDTVEAAYHAILATISSRPRLLGDSFLAADVSFVVLGSAD